VIDRAFALAAELHRGQTRPGTDVPYLAHLLGVCALVLEQGGGETEACAALLHDAVEDQGGEPTLARIRSELGTEVARIVEALTDGPQEDWRERKQAYLDRLDDEPADVLRVSLADKLDNVRTLARERRAYGEAVWERAGKDPDYQRWYFGALIDVFRRRAPGIFTDELAREVESLTS
jgi:(p)ppGpp synthase/HD superfamily hydrolase